MTGNEMPNRNLVVGSIVFEPKAVPSVADQHHGHMRRAAKPPRVAKPTIERLVDEGGESNFNHSMSRSAMPTRKRDELGPLRMLVAAEGYAMVRRPGAMVFVMTVKEWLALDDVTA